MRMLFFANAADWNCWTDCWLTSSYEDPQFSVWYGENVHDFREEND